MIRNQDDYNTLTLQVPDEYRGEKSQWYSRRSKLIVLQGPRGPLVARYINTNEPPDPTRHEFVTTFPENYRVFEGAEVPDMTRAETTAIAWPVEQTKSPQSTVSDRTPPDLSGEVPSQVDDVILAAGNVPEDNMARQEGLRLGREGFTLRTGQGELSVGQDGVRVGGGFTQPNTTEKGVTAESPIFGLLPKTLVTFFASDYLPSLDFLQQIASYLQEVRQMSQRIRAVRRIIDQN